MTQRLLTLKSKGVSSKGFNCSACGFPIVSDDLMKNRGGKFLLFICGHVYHCKCVKEKNISDMPKRRNETRKFMLSDKAKILSN